jgi:hypothetical protein
MPVIQIQPSPELNEKIEQLAHCKKVSKADAVIEFLKENLLEMKNE